MFFKKEEDDSTERTKNDLLKDLKDSIDDVSLIKKHSSTSFYGIASFSKSIRNARKKKNLAKD